MNKGGFSWKRLVGISAAKSRLSRQIGVPLTASGRRRKLGATVYNAVGPVMGTLAVAAVAISKQEKSHEESKQGQARLPRGVYFCLVKGVTHNNDDGSSRVAAQQACSMGDNVNLVADPRNPHDRNAIKVMLQSGQQIGFISSTQAARFAGKVHLLRATVHSRVADQWGNETLKLRVVNTTEQQVYLASSGSSKKSPTTAEAIQSEALELGKKEGWQTTLIYFENAEHESYQVVLAENIQHVRQTLQEGLVRVGFIGGKDAPKGIQFSFSLADGIPTNGVVAKRFLINGREWVTNRSKEVSAQKGIAAPIVHNFKPSEQLASQPTSSPGAKVLGALVGVGVLWIAFSTGHWGVAMGLLVVPLLYLAARKKEA
jgi:hypothetical protein